MIKRHSTLALVMIAMFAALTAIGAFIKIPLPIVPFTLQIVFVFLAGCLLGSRNGLYSQLVYIGVGLVGLPVFTQGGGITYVVQPTFGYLIGFALAAYVIGMIVERIESTKEKAFYWGDNFRAFHCICYSCSIFIYRFKLLVRYENKLVTCFCCWLCKQYHC
ncbi:biotin transporter BioY [Lysinibacillus fusiformis]